MNAKRVSFGMSLVLLYPAFVSPGLANDDMSLFSGGTQLNGNNGWQDWGWVTHYLTNNPAWNGHYTMAFAASGSWQAWYLEHDQIDTSIYNRKSPRVNIGRA